MSGRLVLPPLASACRMTVCIPARNEAETIGAALTALATQRDADAFDVVVFANNCTDATVRQARSAARMHPHLNVAVVETELAPSAAHVGSARKLVMDSAAERFIAAGRPSAIVATTDADTRVEPDWVRCTQVEMRLAEAIAGLVEISPADVGAMPPAVRALYERETAFRRVWTELESLVDPLPEDPFPRHGAFVGASLAVTAGLYVRAGGMPAVPCLEDREFLAALRRVDARIRHSPDVRAFTSDRREGRVVGGFGTFMNHLYTFGSNGKTFLVRDPHRIVAELETRASLRRVWRGEPNPGDVASLCDAFAIDAATLRARVYRAEPFGAVHERLYVNPDTIGADGALVPVDAAIVLLRAAVASRTGTGALRSSEAVLARDCRPHARPARRRE